MERLLDSLWDEWIISLSQKTFTQTLLKLNCVSNFAFCATIHLFSSLLSCALERRAHNQNKWGISGYLTGASHSAGRCSRTGKRKCLNLGSPLLERQDMFPALLGIFLDKFLDISAVKCLSDKHAFP